jgi:hypothetical protein
MLRSVLVLTLAAGGCGSRPIAGITADTGPLLTVTLVGPRSGRIVSDPPGIDCPGKCSARFGLDSEVVLDAIPDAGGAAAA